MKSVVAAVFLLALMQAAGAQYYPDRYGYAWYSRQYSSGYYRAPYYGGIPMGCPGCYGRSHNYAQPYYPRSGFGDYRQYRYVAPHHYYRTRHPQDSGGEFGIGW